MKRYGLVARFLIIILVISALIFVTGCKLGEGSTEVEELKNKIAELEEELAKSESKPTLEAEESTVEEETQESIEEETQGSSVEALKDKVCLIDTALGDFTKFQSMLFEKEMDLIKEFEPAGYNSISLAILFKPNDARITKLYDYINNGGKAVCYYDNNTTRYNDTFDNFFGVSITNEVVYEDNTNSITLDGKLFSDFTEDLKIAFIKQIVTTMKINSYINDVDGSSLWHSEFLSQKTSKSNYFALVKSIGNGKILFIPQVAAIIPFNDDHYDNMDNAEFAKRIVEWSFD